jgi:uncharacterized iron-regulated membrane protein
MSTAWWRRWHRWVGLIAGLFLVFAGVTGVIVAMNEFFGEEEALREATRALTSPVTTSSTASDWADPIQRAIATANQTAPGAPIDKIVVQFKGDQPTVDLFLGKPGGGEDRRLVMESSSGRLLKNEAYADKPLINRIHSGEFFGDGGLVFAMFWGAGLAWLGGTGLFIYYTMRPRNEAKRKLKILW